MTPFARTVTAMSVAVTALMLGAGDTRARERQPWILDATQAVADGIAEAKKAGKHVLLKLRRRLVLGMSHPRKDVR